MGLPMSGSGYYSAGGGYEQSRRALEERVAEQRRIDDLLRR